MMHIINVWQIAEYLQQGNAQSSRMCEWRFCFSFDCGFFRCCCDSPAPATEENNYNDGSKTPSNMYSANTDGNTETPSNTYEEESRSIESSGSYYESTSISSYYESTDGDDGSTGEPGTVVLQAIIGGVAGAAGVLLLAIVVVLIVLLMRRKSSKPQQAETDEGGSYHNAVYEPGTYVSH